MRDYDERDPGLVGGRWDAISNACRTSLSQPFAISKRTSSFRARLPYGICCSQFLQLWSCDSPRLGIIGHSQSRALAGPIATFATRLVATEPDVNLDGNQLLLTQWFNDARHRLLNAVPCPFRQPPRPHPGPSVSLFFPSIIDRDTLLESTTQAAGQASCQLCIPIRPRRPRFTITLPPAPFLPVSVRPLVLLGLATSPRRQSDLSGRSNLFSSTDDTSITAPHTPPSSAESATKTVQTSPVPVIPLDRVNDRCMEEEEDESIIPSIPRGDKGKGREQPLRSSTTKVDHDANTGSRVGNESGRRRERSRERTRTWAEAVERQECSYTGGGTPSGLQASRMSVAQAEGHHEDTLRLRRRVKIRSTVEMRHTRWKPTDSHRPNCLHRPEVLLRYRPTSVPQTPMPVMSIDEIVKRHQASMESAMSSVKIRARAEMGLSPTSTTSGTSSSVSAVFKARQSSLSPSHGRRVDHRRERASIS